MLERLKGDQEIVLAAVTQDRSALDYAAEQLKSDPEVSLLHLSLHVMIWKQTWTLTLFALPSGKKNKENPRKKARTSLYSGSLNGGLSNI